MGQGTATPGKGLGVGNGKGHGAGSGKGLREGTGKGLGEGGRDMEKGLGRVWEQIMGWAREQIMGREQEHTPVHSHAHAGMYMCMYIYIYIYIYLYLYLHTCPYRTPRTLLGRGPFKDPPPHFPPSPRQPIRAHHPQPIKARLPSGPPANQRLPLSTHRLRAPRPGRELLRAPEASGAAALSGSTREPATAALRPGDEPPLPCRIRRTLCQPSWSHKELCACARCGGAVAGARGIVGAVVQVERSARHCGSCSAEAGQHLDPPAVPPLTSGSRGG